MQSVADESLSLVDIENMLLQKVKDRKDDLKAAFRAFDQEGSATVTKGEFRRVIEGFLVPLTQSQFDGLFAKVRKFFTLFTFRNTHCYIQYTLKCLSDNGYVHVLFKIRM